jgi:GNAT superfamily N-acetyltransferase
MGIGILSMMIAHPGFHVVVAERDGEIVGSNVLDERSEIAGIGPITVDPRRQNAGVGRMLMQHVILRASSFAGVRLVQAAFHNRSLSLYTKLGFDPREPLSCVQGTPLAKQLPGSTVRQASVDDLAEIDALCQRVHDHTRSGEVADAIHSGNAQVVERAGRITGYATGIAFFTHAVGATNEDVQALIAAAPIFHGPGFLVPTRNAALLRWCLEQGLRIVQPLTLMSMGRYEQPRGAWLASIAY